MWYKLPSLLLTNSSYQVPIRELLLDSLEGRDHRMAIRAVGADSDGPAAGLVDLGHDVVVALGLPGEESHRVCLGEFEGH